MAVTQKYGIKYPFSSNNNEMTFIDTNSTYADGIKSQVLHVIFTPKGQRLRNPDFGTNLIKYIFSPKDELTLNDIKAEITLQISKYVNGVTFRNVEIIQNENDDNGIIVLIEYSTKKGEKTEITNVAVKL